MAMQASSPTALGARARPQAMQSWDRRLLRAQGRQEVVCKFLPFGREILAESEPTYSQRQLDGIDEASRVDRPVRQLEESYSDERPLPAVAPLPEPKLKLISRFKGPTQQSNADVWKSFVGKCQLAWDVFFPVTPEVMSPATAVKSRLQVILVSDRCGLDLATLMKIKQDSMAQMARINGWDTLTELELQVERVKGNGDTMTMTLPLKNIPDRHALRDPNDYHYEGEDQAEKFEGGEEEQDGI